MGSMLEIGAPVPSALAEAVVLGADGSGSPLAERWRDRAALIVFLRHFGCIGCTHQVTELSQRLAELERLGVGTTLVGNGAPHYIAGFVERHLLSDKPVELVTDPTLAAFAAAGLVRSIWGVIGPRGIRDILRAAAAGHRQQGLAGDGSQQGGALLVDRGGTLRLYHRNRSLGDFAPHTALVDAALQLGFRRAQAAGQPLV